MLLQHSRFLLILIAALTFLLTITSVRVLSGFIAAQHTAASVSKGAISGEWGRFIGQTEANIGNHIPHLLHHDSKTALTGVQNAQAGKERYMSTKCFINARTQRGNASDT